LNRTIDPTVSLLDYKRPVSTVELANWLNKSTFFVMRAVQRKQLRARKVGGAVLYMPEDVRAWLEGEPVTEGAEAK
jgi:hypothetical protein